MWRLNWLKAIGVHWVKSKVGQKLKLGLRLTGGKTDARDSTWATYTLVSRVTERFSNKTHCSHTGAQVTCSKQCNQNYDPQTNTWQEDPGLERVNLKVLRKTSGKIGFSCLAMVMKRSWHCAKLSDATTVEILTSNAWRSASQFARNFMSAAATIVGQNLEFKSITMGQVQFTTNK